MKLDNITVDKLKKMSNTEINDLCVSIRQFLISISKEKEIHLSSNLGIIEVTISIFLSFNFEKDKIIYDTGHQTYVHKIITGRFEDIINLKTDKSKGGLMEINSSKYDHYSPGHSGNILSVISGLYDSKNYNVCIIGDSALNTGISFEGLNYIGDNNLKIIIVINDNQMSISKAKGALTKYLNTEFNKTENWFTNLGFEYIGKIDGHNINELNGAFILAKKIVINKPVIIHVLTRKGKGLLEAENDKIGAFHTPQLSQKEKFGDISAKFLMQKNNDKLIIINPAMNFGSGFSQFINYKNYIDTGICESHALSLSSGYALKNKKVFTLFYSTFLQRAYDQLIHDCSRLSINLTILLDRSDLAPNEGNSHHGIFDVGYLKSIPNIQIYSPRNFNQLNYLLNFCWNNDVGINVIRYPTKPFSFNIIIDKNNSINIDSVEKLIDNDNDICVLTYGPYTNIIYDELIKNNIKCDLLCTLKINNIDSSEFKYILNKYKNIIVYERIYGKSGLYNEIIDFAIKNNINKNIINFSYSNFPGVGTIKSIDLKQGMDVSNIINYIKNTFNN